MVNHYYFYGIDADFGPFFLKFCSYLLYNANPQRLQQLCNGLSAAKIDALLRKWLARLPHPYTAADRRAGYRYDVSILQIELSLTQVLDRPVSGRIFFEQVI